MPLSYQDIENQLSALILAYCKKLNSSWFVFNKKEKVSLAKNCENILLVMSQHKDDYFALIECMATLLAKYGSVKKRNKNIKDKFYSKMRQLLDQFIICKSASDICKQNGITPFSQKTKMTLQDDIAAHSSLLFKKIYTKKHILDEEEQVGVARAIHGVQHVNRVAYYIPVLANLYRRHGDDEAQELTNDDIKLMQIAALFHDAARRKGIDKDDWDHESGLLVYDYFVKILKISDKKARLVAEAIINKEPKEDGRYFQLVHHNGKLCWEVVQKIKRNIYHKLIHDADSLDIIRVRQAYNAEYLDFYNQIAEVNPQARKEMAELICEVRSLIENQGDGYQRQIEDIKKTFENKNGYQRTVEQVTTFASEKNQYRLLSSLYKPNIESLKLNQLRKMELLVKPGAYDKKKKLIEENMRAALEAGMVFSRGVVDPSAIVQKKDKADETQVELEIRKTLRRRGIATRTKKPNRTKKYGNPNRSVSLLGYGAIPYSASGFIIIDEDKKHKKIKYVSKSNLLSGFGKKRNIQNILGMLPGYEEKQAKLDDLIWGLEMGGGLNAESKTLHSEIIYHTDNYDAIYFTSDAVFGNRSKIRGIEMGKPFHPHAPLLQAIFLQKEYERQSGTCLPIFEYSGIHKFIRSQPNLSEDDIATLWITMCTDFIKEQINIGFPRLFTMTFDQIKAYSMYGDLGVYIGKENRNMDAADKYLPSTLRVKIDNAIKKEIEKLRGFFIEKIQNKELALFSPLSFTVLKTSASISDDMRKRIARKIKMNLQNVNRLHERLNNFVQKGFDTRSTSSELPENLKFLMQYVELINDKASVDFLKQIAISVVSEFKNIDLSFISFEGKRGFIKRTKAIVDLFSIQEELDKNFFEDIIIKCSDCRDFFMFIAWVECEETPKIIEHARKLISKMPYDNNLGFDFGSDAVTYIKRAKKYGISEREICNGVEVFVDKLIKKNKMIYDNNIFSIIDEFLPFADFLNGKLFHLLNQVHLIYIENAFSVIELLSKLKNVADEKACNLDQSIYDGVLIKLSFSLLENVVELNNYPDSETLSLLNKITFNRPLEIPDDYRNNMVKLMHALPKNKEGKMLATKVLALNLKLGFDLDLYMQAKPSLSVSKQAMFAAKFKGNKKSGRLVKKNGVDSVRLGN